jgi:hypothetical protein
MSGPCTLVVAIFLLESICYAAPVQVEVANEPISKKYLESSNVFGLTRPVGKAGNLMTEHIRITVAEQDIFVSPLAFSDLLNLDPTEAKISAYKSGYTISLHGGDGEHGYSAVLTVNSEGGLIRRAVTTLFDKQVLTLKSYDLK